MAAPILPLYADSLCSFTNVGIVGAWMLFPDDAKWREKLKLNAATKEGLERLRKGLVPHDAVEGLVIAALLAASDEDIAAQWEERAKRACGAGRIVYDVVKIIQLQRAGKAPMEKAKREVERIIWGRNASASKHVDEAVWRKFRSVAALWAAFIFLNKDNEGPSPGIVFPCEGSDLREFLERAEGFRQLAEETNVAHHGPVLKPGESVGLSPEIKAQLTPGRMVTVPTQIGTDVPK